MAKPLPKESALDRAIIAYREDPSEENRRRLDALQRAHVRAFLEQQTREFQRRTH